MRAVMWAGVAVIAVIASACLASYLLLGHLGQGRISGWVQPRIDSQQIPELPRLETRPAQTLPNYLREEHARLETYRWIDREHGVVQIPIERAMQQLAAQNRTALPRPGQQPAASHPAAASEAGARPLLAHRADTGHGDAGRTSTHELRTAEPMHAAGAPK
jgi:hypothetical protein